MRTSHFVFIIGISCSLAVESTAQSSANETIAQPAPASPSALMQSSLDNVQRTLIALRLDKWKKGDIREGASTNIASILRDLNGRLPTLLRDADRAPDAVSTVLPASQNIDALYDVLLRVVEASRVAAPSDQIDQLANILVDLEHARNALDDRLQKTATAQESQLRDLQTKLQAQGSALQSARALSSPPPCASQTPARARAVRNPLHREPQQSPRLPLRLQICSI